MHRYVSELVFECLAHGGDRSIRLKNAGDSAKQISRLHLRVMNLRLGLPEPYQYLFTRYKAPRDLTTSPTPHSLP